MVVEHSIRAGRCRVASSSALLILCLLIVREGRCQSSASAVEQVARFLQQSEPDKALAATQAALARSPKDCAVLTLRALAFSRLDREPDAASAYDRAIRICPRYLPALEGAAELKYSLHDKGAVDVLHQLIRVDPQNSIAHAMLAVLLESGGDCKAASPEYAAASPLFSSRPDLVQGYGRCLVHEERYAEALMLYKEQMRATAGPNYALMYNIALLQMKLGLPEEAMSTLAPLLELKYPSALALASGVKEEEGDTPAAVALLRAAIEQEPNNTDNYLDFAVISFRHSSYEAGVTILDAGVKQQPASPQLLVARAVLEIQIDRNDDALSDLKRAHDLEPNLSIVEDVLGMMRVQQRDVKASSFFQDAVRAHPEDAFLQYLLAEQLSEEAGDPADRRFRLAVETGERAVKLKPDYTAAHDLLARLFVRAGQYEQAIKEARTASSLDPHDESALYQEILARRHNKADPELNQLVTRFKAVKQENLLQRQKVDRFRLQTPVDGK